MKLLFVSLWPMEANTSAALRNHALIQGLLELGCEVDVLTTSANQNSLFFDDSMQLNGRVRWIFLNKHGLYNKLVTPKQGVLSLVKKTALFFARKLYHSFSLFDHTVRIAKQLRLSDLPHRTYDCVISSSDPKTSHLAVKQLIRDGLQVQKWIQYWGDPLTLDITKKHVLPAFYVRSVEQSILAGADRIVYVSPFTLEAQQQLLPRLADRMMFAPVPYAREKIYPSMVRDSSDSPLRVGYFGDYHRHVRNILPLLEACRQQSGTFELIVAGNTDLQLADEKGIRYLPRVSQEAVEQMEADCDLLVCLLNLRGTQIPGKVYHYAATNKPVLIILDGEHQEQLKAYFAKFDRYETCANDAHQIAAAVRSIGTQQKTSAPSPHFSARTIAATFLQAVHANQQATEE